MNTRKWNPDALQHSSEDSNELYHYGVPGMRWGIRKARKKGVDYAYTSRATKRYARKAARFQKRGDLQKAKKYDSYAKRSQDLDRRIQSSVEAGRKGKNWAERRLLRGNYGKMSFHTIKAAVGSTNISAQVYKELGRFGARKARDLYVKKGQSQRRIADTLGTKAYNKERTRENAARAARAAVTTAAVSGSGAHISVNVRKRKRED